jgi:FkbM family methyltransferase
MKRIFNNKFVAKIFNLFKKKKDSFKFFIKGFYIFYNSENRFIRSIRNKIISVSIKNWNWWKLSLLSKKSVESEFLDYVIDRINKPEVILDLGSSDAIQSIEFSIVFPEARIFAFECNPPSIKVCNENILNLKNIEIIPKAVFNENGFIKFYPALVYKGASSLFKVSSNFDSIKKLSQKEIKVEATRIDTWAKERKIDKIDIGWLDLQGVEYEALEGMGDLIYTVQALYVEVEQQEIYNGQKLYDDVVNFLKSKDFSMVKYHPSKPGWWGNAIFLNNKLLPKK